MSLDKITILKTLSLANVHFRSIQEDVNIIRVDWAPGAGLPYLRALTNTQVVGAEISL